MPCFQLPGDISSRFPASDEPGVLYFNTSALDGSAGLLDNQTAYFDAIGGVLWPLLIVPLTRCPLNCSYEGTCTLVRSQPPQSEGSNEVSNGTSSAPPSPSPPLPPSPSPPPPPSPELSFRCQCNLRFNGEGCELSPLTACFNNCSGHGLCVRGWCVCDFGYFGIDCSTTSSPALAGSDPTVGGDLANRTLAWSTSPVLQQLSLPMRPQANRLSIYVYELPAWLSLQFRIDRIGYGSSEIDNIYGEFIIFLEELLHSTGVVRTLDPNEANLFYVPALLFYYSSNTGAPHEQAMVLVRFLQRHYPQFWARNHGADHIMFAAGDRAMCYEDLPDELSSMIWLVSYGQTQKLTDESQPCLTLTNMVVLPSPVTWDNTDVLVANETYNNPSLDANRSTFFFFAGSLRLDEHPEADPLNFSYTKNDYSQGVRQRVWALYANKSGYLIASPDIEDMAGEMRKSRFCLAPTGYGFGNRIIWAALTGCVPVIISDGVAQPLEDVLPYSSFSVRVAEKDIPQLNATLRLISDKEVAELQRNLKAYHQAFFLNGGRAFAYAVQSLELKLLQLRAGERLFPNATLQHEIKTAAEKAEALSNELADARGETAAAQTALEEAQRRAEAAEAAAAEAATSIEALRAQLDAARAAQQAAEKAAREAAHHAKAQPVEGQAAGAAQAAAARATESSAKAQEMKERVSMLREKHDKAVQEAEEEAGR